MLRATRQWPVGLGLGLLLVGVPAAQAGPLMMSAEWATAACEAWNGDPVLTDELAKSGWAGNDKGRGYKIIHFYRSDCEKSPRVEVSISQKDGKALCTYGGAVQHKELDTGVDYVMYAKTQRWVQMGNGDYGPMKAMMFGRLGFEGPMWEAMKNMGPFENFLLLVGKVPSETTACP
ncbi:MAG TPA: sterol-binding protein [Acidiferrobacteraceae bacterium]|nr:sterol-binding protein [Acidiferrobacteraceae bacterium]